jgi:hypothetical protein
LAILLARDAAVGNKVRDLKRRHLIVAVFWQLGRASWGDEVPSGFSGIWTQVLSTFILTNSLLITVVTRVEPIYVVF